jgi:hypothetical protein
MFYKKSFKALREELKTQGNTEHMVGVALRNDPGNEYSDSGRFRSLRRLKIPSNLVDWLPVTHGCG